MSNKSNGTAFERELAERLAAAGFWVHRLQDTANGQPFDLLAAKGGKAWAIDCKECTFSVFPFSRIEENQKTALWAWEEAGNGSGLFAIRFGNWGIWMIPAVILRELEQEGRRQVPFKEARIFSEQLPDWIQSAGEGEGHGAGYR